MASPEMERCLEASVSEGLAAQVAGGVVDYYVVPLAVFLNAPTGAIGWLAAGMGLVSAAAQFFAVDVLRAIQNRRRLLVIGAALQGLLLLPVAALPLLFHGGRLAALFAAVAAFKIVGGFMGPAWGSLMSEYLPDNERGRYFGRRSRLLGVCTAVLLVACGLALRRLGTARGLALVFLVGGAARLLSVRWMRLMLDMPEHRQEALSTSFDIARFARRLRESNFVRFTGYVAALTFATQLASTFYTVYMLRDLKFGLLEYSAISVAGALGAFAAYPLWGRHADRVGNVRVMRLCGFLVAATPLPWVFFREAGLIFACELARGAIWAGFSLCSGNYVSDAVAARSRMKALGYFNMANGLAVFAGAALGGRLASALPPLLGSPMRSLFALSALLRLAAVAALAPRFVEVRRDAQEASSLQLFFSVVGIRPLGGASR